MRRRLAALHPAALVLLALALVLPVAASAQTVGTFASGLGDVRGLRYDGAGNLYAILRGPTHRIVRFALPSNVPTLVTATGLSDPIEGVFGEDGNLYVTDYTAGWVKKVTPGGTVTNFAPAAAPAPIARDAAGDLYVGEYFSQKILRVTPAGAVSTYVPAVGSAGARLSMLYMDTDGSLYAGTLTGVIYRIGPGGSPITTFCSGLGSTVGFERGPDGAWYTTTYEVNTIRRITPDGVSSLYAGSTAGLVNGPLASARFNYPAFVQYVPPVMYVADFNNNAIRTISGFTTPVSHGSWGRVKALYR